jgi:hypothetical protein
MSFESKKLELALGDMVSVAIGDRLSTMRKMVDGTVVDVPSVILARNMSPISGKVPPAPDYPFVMVDKAQTQKVVSVQEKYFDGDDHIHETGIVVRVNVKIFGTSDHDVDDIAGLLDQSFTVDDYRNLIETNYGKRCRMMRTSDVVTTAASLNDVYQEVATFDVYFSTVRSFTVKDAPSFGKAETPELDLKRV